MDMPITTPIPRDRHPWGRRALLALTTVALAGCATKPATKSEASERGRADEKAAKPTSPAKDADDMRAMPGMATVTPKAGSDPAAAKKDGDAAGGASATVVFTAAQVQHGQVRWAPVTLGTAASLATVPGQVVPNEDHTARLGALAGGRVVAVRVSPGDRVRPGQVLVTLASPDAGMAQSDVSKATAAVTGARAQAAYAKSARDRAERLLALKAIPRQDYERAIADDAAARATLAQDEAEVRRARSTVTQLGGGAAVIGEIAVRSPLAGVVLTRTATPGAVVDAGTPLVVVTDPTSLWLTVNAPEALSGLFRRGGMLQFSVPAYPGDTFTARVDAVGAGLDPETRTLPVRAVVAARGGTLKPEMLATVVVAGGPQAPAVLLPDDAVQLVDGRPSVFLATPNAKGGATFTARAVETGARANGRIAVTRGLAAGDVVVTAGAFAVKAQLQKGSMPDMEM